MSEWLGISLLPDSETQPRISFKPLRGDKCPAIDFTDRDAMTPVRVQFNIDDPVPAVRYLRRLAELAADLADQIEYASRCERGETP